MLTGSPDNLCLPHWRVHSLSPSEEEQELQVQDLDTDHDSGLGLAKSLSDHPSWEDKLVSKIQVMTMAKRSLVLEDICVCLQEGSVQVGKPLGSEVVDTSFQELLSSVDQDLGQPLGKNFCFYSYGLVLRESPRVLLTQHLPRLLELSHQNSVHREGIALAVGLASVSHLEEVWALLEHLGQTRFLKSPLQASDSQPEPDMHWKWLSSTTLLCYGQMVLWAKEQILPWVDNIVSRMVYYFSYSNYDHVLKMSFLSTAITLTKVLRWEYDAQSYKFTQIPELLQCLLCILQKEPNFLDTLLRQKIILVILGLSHLQPYLKPTVKSRILKTCLQSVYSLPPVETMESSEPLLKPGLDVKSVYSLPPVETMESSEPLLKPGLDVKTLYKKTMQAFNLLLQHFISENETMDEMDFFLQHTETWLQSRKSHERKQVVLSIFLLLQFAVEELNLTDKTMPSMLGRQVGLLTLLWRDKENVTQYHSRHCVYLLLQLLTRQRGTKEESTYLTRLKSLEAKGQWDLEMMLYSLVQALDKILTVAQHTQLMLTFLQGLGSPEHLGSDLAAELLCIVFEGPGVKPEQVAEILQSLFQELPSIAFRDVQLSMMKSVTALGVQHTQETVEVVLTLNPPTNRQVLAMWKALGANDRLARKVVTVLYMKMKQRPATELVRPSHQAQLVSMLALGTIYELLYMVQYKPTVRWAFAGILLGLLTQLHYLFELGCVDGIADSMEDTLDLRPLSPSRTCLEALMGLFWTTNYWEVFAYMKLMGGWELLQYQSTYADGVTLLARAMAHHSCEVNAVLGQATISLKSPEERDNLVAILIITEFLNSHELTQYATRKTMGHFLNLGLNNPNQLVRAMSLKGISSILMHPKKVGLLQSRLEVLVDSLVKPQPQDLLGLMQVVGQVLHCLGPHSKGTVSLKMARHLMLLFENDKEEVRESAIFLFSDVIYCGDKKFEQPLKDVVFQALVPLLFHLADPCPRVVAKTKFTFLCCAILLKWEFRKELFSKLAWGQGLGAKNDVFIYMVESNFGSYHQFFIQASAYLGSPLTRLKRVAMKFMEVMLHDYFMELCFYLKKDDMKLLRKHLELLRQDQDSVSHKFYLRLLGDIEELALYVT